MQYVPNATPGAKLDHFGVGKAGFQNGDPTTGTKGTQIAAGVFNDMLGNLLRAVEAAGLVPTPDRLDDLKDAIGALSALRPLAIKTVTGYQIVAADNGKTIIYDTAGGPLATTLPDITAMPVGFNVELRCEGPHAVTVNRTGAQTIEGATSLTVGAKSSALLLGDTVVWRTLVSRSGLYVPGQQLITATGNWIVPPGVSLVLAEAEGGCSGAAGSISTAYAPAPGSGGGYARKLCTVTPGQSIACTIGPGGVGGAAGGGTGGSGGTTSFGAFCSATGATGGQSTSTSPGVSPGGVPGIGVGGDENLSGTASGDGINVSGGGGHSPPPGRTPRFNRRGGWVAGYGGAGYAGDPGCIVLRW